jgi:hypothetical protein
MSPEPPTFIPHTTCRPSAGSTAIDGFVQPVGKVQIVFTAQPEYLSICSTSETLVVSKRATWMFPSEV